MAAAAQVEWLFSSLYHQNSKCLSESLDLIFSQGLSNTWHYFQEHGISASFSLRLRLGKKLFCSLTPALMGTFHHIKVFWMPVRQCFKAYFHYMDAIHHFGAQTLIETWCTFDFGHWGKSNSCCITPSWLMLSFWFIKSRNHKYQALWKTEAKTVSSN